MSAPSVGFDGMDINDGVIYAILPDIDLGAATPVYDEYRSYAGTVTQANVTTAKLVQMSIPMKVSGTSVANLGANIEALNVKIRTATADAPHALVFDGVTYSVVASPEISPPLTQSYQNKFFAIVDMVLNRLPTVSGVPGGGGGGGWLPGQGSDDPSNVKYYGALGDGVTDDTTAIQAAIDAALSISGGSLYFPDGQYLISSSLEIPLYTGWTIQGQSRGGTVIVQDTDDEPCITFTEENCHSFHLCDLSFSWTNAQPADHTNAVALLVDTSTHTGGGVYNGTFERLSWDKGFRGFYGLYAVWGCQFDQIWHGSSMTGACFWMEPSPGIGQPHDHFGRIYVNGASATEALIYLVACGNCTIRNYEVNSNDNGQVILRTWGGSTVTVDSIDLEGGTYDTSGDFVIANADGPLHIGMLCVGATFGATGSHYIYKAEASVAPCHVGILNVGALPEGADNVFAFNGGRVTVDHIHAMNDISLTDVDNTPAADSLTVTDWCTPRLSTDNGDANVVLAMGDKTVQMFQTALSTDRSIRLPNHFAPSDAFNGAWFRIVRTGGGAGVLDISSSSGTPIVEIPAATNAIVEMMYRRNSWVCVGYTELP